MTRLRLQGPLRGPRLCLGDWLSPWGHSCPGPRTGLSGASKALFIKAGSSGVQGDGRGEQQKWGGDWAQPGRVIVEEKSRREIRITLCQGLSSEGFVNNAPNN